MRPFLPRASLPTRLVACTVDYLMVVNDSHCLTSPRTCGVTGHKETVHALRFPAILGSHFHAMIDLWSLAFILTSLLRPLLVTPSFCLCIILPWCSIVAHFGATTVLGRLLSKVVFVPLGACSLSTRVLPCNTYAEEICMYVFVKVM